jgi:proline iminopeptidase
MKHLLRICVVSSIILALASLAHGQDGPTRAEFECLTLNNTSGVAAPGNTASFPSYHHVWTPGLTYGSFKSNGLDLLYETQGDGNEVVIVAHGGPGLPHEYFHPMLSNLSHYAKLVYFDRRADMLSTRLPHQPVSLDEMADDLDALRQSLGLNRVTLLGHSFGVAIALNYALRYPENVKRLILVSASAGIENPAEAEKRIVKKLLPVELALYRSSESGRGAANPCERVRKRYSVLYPHYFHKLIPYEFSRGIYTAYFDSLAKRLALANPAQRLDVRDQLSAIKVPVMVVAGRYDLVTPLDQSVALADGLPHSKLVVMEHSAHFPFFEENYLFTQWVRQFMVGTNDMFDDRATPGAVASSSSGKR